MAAPQSTPLPPVPQRNESESEFIAKSNAWVAAQEPLRVDLQAQADFVNNKSVEVESNAALAAASEEMALAAANYAGEWSSLTGAGVKGISVAHNGSYWGLLINIADIPSNEPGVSGFWQIITKQLGAAASKDTGTAPDQVPLNSDLGRASKLDAGIDFDQVPFNYGIVYPVDSVQDIAGLVGTQDSQQISLKGWHPGSDVGGGTLYWDAAKPKSEHNGGTVFSPTVPYSVTTGDYLDGVGETAAGGSGCWVRVYEGSLLTDWFSIPTDGSEVEDLLHRMLDISPDVTLNGGDFGIGTDYYADGLKAVNGMRLRFANDARLLAVNRDVPFYRVLDIGGVSDVRVYNPVIVGTADTNTATGEHGYGIHVNSGASNVRIYNGHLSRCFGDGMIVTDGNDIKVYNTVMTQNRRQGLSITDCIGFRAYDCEFSDTVGTLPEYGVDIEPNLPTDNILDVKFINCVAKNSASRIGFGCFRMVQDNPVDVQFVNCSTLEGDMFQIKNCEGGNGLVSYDNCISKNAYFNGVNFVNTDITVNGSVYIESNNQGNRTLGEQGCSVGLQSNVSNIDLDVSIANYSATTAPVGMFAVDATGGAVVTNNKFRVTELSGAVQGLTGFGLSYIDGLYIKYDRNEVAYGGALTPALYLIQKYNNVILTNEGRAYSLNHDVGSSPDWEGNTIGLKVYLPHNLRLILLNATAEGFTEYSSSSVGSEIILRYLSGKWWVDKEIGVWAKA